EGIPETLLIYISPCISHRLRRTYLEYVRFLLVVGRQSLVAGRQKAFSRSCSLASYRSRTASDQRLTTNDCTTHSMCRGRRRSRRLRAKVHLRRSARRFRRLEVRRVLLVAGKPRIQIVRELQHIGVVILQRVVITFALDGDPVLGPRQLVLQAQKIFI